MMMFLVLPKHCAEPIYLPEIVCGPSANALGHPAAAPCSTLNHILCAPLVGILDISSSTMPTQANIAQYIKQAVFLAN